MNDRMNSAEFRRTALAKPAAPKPSRTMCVGGGPFGPFADRWQGPLTVMVRDEPRSQPRHRAMVIPAAPGQGKRCRCGKCWTARMYLPDGDDEQGQLSPKAWKDLVILSGRRVQPATPLAGPVAVALSFSWHAPEYMLRWGVELPCLKPSLPDGDNVEKAVIDAMSAGGWWHNDSQVAWVMRSKWYVAHDQPQGVLVEVWHLPQPEEQPRLLG